MKFIQLYKFIYFLIFKSFDNFNTLHNFSGNFIRFQSRATRTSTIWLQLKGMSLVDKKTTNSFTEAKLSRWKARNSILRSFHDEQAYMMLNIILYSNSLLSFSFVFILEASPNMAPKSSQKSIVEVNVDRGSKVNLPCNIQGNPLPMFTWYRLSDSGSYYSVPSSQRIVPSQTLLLIRNVDDRDAGRWVNVASVNFRKVLMLQ